MKKMLALSLILSASVAFGAEVDKLENTTKTWDGVKLKAKQINNPNVTMLRIVIKAGEKLPVHKHPVINAGYLTKGELTVVKPETGEKNVLKAGDSLVEVVDTWHYGVNNGSTDAEIIVFYVGEKGQALTIKK